MKRLTFAAMAFVALAACTVQTRPGADPVGPTEPPPPPPRRHVVEAPPPQHEHRPRPRPDRRSEWERNGYRLLSEIAVPPGQNGGKMVLDMSQGAVTDVALVVVDGELDLFGAVLTYRGGGSQPLGGAKRFNDGDSHTAALKNTVRGIETVYFRVKGDTTRGSPRVQLWGRDASPRGMRSVAQPVFATSAEIAAPAVVRAPLVAYAQAPPAPSRPVRAPKAVPAPTPAATLAPQLPTTEWQRRGYKLLGEISVPRGQDGGKFTLDMAQGRNTEIALVVVGGELRIFGAVLTYRGGGSQPLGFDHTFVNGSYHTSTLVNTVRGIETVYFRSYGGQTKGAPRVQLWGRDTTAPAPPPPAPAPPAWNPSGWTLLGAQEVGGRRDRDTVSVSGAAGAFSHLTLVVENSDVELFDMIVTFADGQTFTPNIRATFREGSRTRAIDLPGTARVIRKIDFRYGNLPGTGRAKVQVWGRASNAPPPPSGPTWDQRGWTLLGGKVVAGFRKRDSIPVRTKGAYFTNLTLAVDTGDVELHDIVVYFANGVAYRPNVRHYFRGGERSRTIDLPGEARMVTKVDFQYANLPRGMRAKVSLWGKAGAAPVDTWQSQGWVELGDKLVSRNGVQRIKVGRNKGGFAKLVLVADGSTLDVTSLRVKFGRGGPVEIPVTHSFRDGSMSREIDLPAESIAIQWIELRYGKLAPRDAARVAVYAK